MKVHEYQAKEILKKFGVAVPPGESRLLRRGGGKRGLRHRGNGWVVKAQRYTRGDGAKEEASGWRRRLRKLRHIASQHARDEARSRTRPV